jgi:hypothetical protein
MAKDIILLWKLIFLEVAGSVSHRAVSICYEIKLTAVFLKTLCEWLLSSNNGHFICESPIKSFHSNHHLCFALMPSFTKVICLPGFALLTQTHVVKNAQ